MSSLLQLAARVGFRRTMRVTRHRLKQITVERDPWFDTESTCDDPAIFIGGCGRSGTTLVREILNRHPNIACGAETAILCDMVNVDRLSVEWNLPRSEIEIMRRESDDVVRFAERFFRTFAEREGKPRWSDKTPRNVLAIPKILAWFPNGKFIHIIRDGRDVACSLRHHPRSTIRNGKIVPAKNNRPIRGGAHRWLTETSLGLAFRGHPRCFELRYEDLVNHPEPTLKRLCEFLQEPFDVAMLDPGAKAPSHDREGRLMNNPDADQKVRTSSAGRWRRDMSMAERRVFRRIAGELLLALGYVDDHSWVEEPID